MRTNGQTKIVEESGAEVSVLPRISCSDYIDKFTDLMIRSRDCELPGTFNPLIIGDLFVEQCQPWRRIANKTKEIIFEAVCRSIQSVFAPVAVQEPIDGMMRLVSHRLDTLKTDLDEKVDELINPHYIDDPITYNHYLTDTVQKVQADRRTRKLDKTLLDGMGLEFFKQNRLYNEVNLTTILSALQQQLEPNMERYAADLAVDYMRAYYKVRQIVL